MGGLWVDYNLMSTIPGLFVIGEANFSDHGANRLGASALMQGLADGYFIVPYTLGNYLAKAGASKVGADHAEFRKVRGEVDARIKKLLAAKGNKPASVLHRELGTLLLDRCGMARNEAGLKDALEKIPKMRERFWKEVSVPGSAADMNQALEVAGRVADFFELAELMCGDALDRDESCGGHFREEHQTEEGEAKRRDDQFSHASVWEWTGDPGAPDLHREPLTFDYVMPSQRSYK
jgi:succinate dehydrogenase / fumarate reductase flavoprotein subunit